MLVLVKFWTLRSSIYDKLGECHLVMPDKTKYIHFYIHKKSFDYICIPFVNFHNIKSKFWLSNNICGAFFVIWSISTSWNWRRRTTWKRTTQRWWSTWRTWTITRPCSSVLPTAPRSPRKMTAIYQNASYRSTSSL